jgi:hypothetical protein
VCIPVLIKRTNNFVFNELNMFFFSGRYEIRIKFSQQLSKRDCFYLFYEQGEISPKKRKHKYSRKAKKFRINDCLEFLRHI